MSYRALLLAVDHVALLHRTLGRLVQLALVLGVEHYSAYAHLALPPVLALLLHFLDDSDLGSDHSETSAQVPYQPPLLLLGHLLHVQLRIRVFSLSVVFVRVDHPRAEPFVIGVIWFVGSMNGVNIHRVPSVLLVVDLIKRHLFVPFPSCSPLLCVPFTFLVLVVLVLVLFVLVFVVVVVVVVVVMMMFVMVLCRLPFYVLFA